MKKIIIGTLALFCLAALVPAAFAGDDANCRPWFTPTLRVGLAVDAQRPLYSFTNVGAALFGGTRFDLKLRSVERPYIALELPFAVTDRFTVALDGDWSFTSWERDVNEKVNRTAYSRTWDSDGNAHWVSTDLLVSYALIKDRSIIKDLSVVAGVRWDYQTMAFHDPTVIFAVGPPSTPLDTIKLRMQTLAPVAGLSLTVGGLKSGIWGGDVHLAVLAGPIVWGSEDYTVTFGPIPFRFKGDLSHGYVVKGYGDITLLSGKITPTMEGSLAFFAQLTKTSESGIVKGSMPGQASPYEFRGDNFTLAFGLGASLAFDICEPARAPAPVAPAPVIEPKLEPMSFK